MSNSYEYRKNLSLKFLLVFIKNQLGIRATNDMTNGKGIFHLNIAKLVLLVHMYLGQEHKNNTVNIILRISNPRADI